MKFFRICVDFDGVLNTYKGNFDENTMYEPKKGAEDFLKELNNLSDELVIHSTRNPDKIKKWLKENNLNQYITKVTNIKVGASIYIDDRGYKFNGNYKETLNDVSNFKAYWED